MFLFLVQVIFYLVLFNCNLLKPSTYQPCFIERMPQPTALTIPKRLFKNNHLRIYSLELILDCNVFIFDIHCKKVWKQWFDAIKNGAHVI